MPEGQQTLDDIYVGNRLDRGHIARRADLLWGSLTEAKAANVDSFSFTNITPQMNFFDQSGQGDRLPAPPPGSAPESWGLLENAVLAFGGLEDRRISVWGGPVLAADDPTYRGLEVTLADLEQRTGVSFADLTSAGATPASPELTTDQAGARATAGPRPGPGCGRPGLVSTAPAQE